MTDPSRSPRSSATAVQRSTFASVALALVALLATACSGPTDPSGPDPLVAQLFLFTADDGVHGVEPWVSDGTPEGTRMLADLAPGAEYGADVIDTWFRFGDTLLFSALTPDGATDALYRTDGTAAGTALLVEGVRFEARSAYPFGDEVVFGNEASRNPLEEGVYRTDGTTAGTVRLGPPVDGFGILGVRVPPVAAHLGHRATDGAIYVRDSDDLARVDRAGATTLSAFDESCHQYFALGVLDGVLYFPGSAPFDDPVTGMPQEARCELWRFDTAVDSEPSVHRAFTISADQYVAVRGYPVRDGWLYYSLIVWEDDGAGGSQVAWQLRATNGGAAPDASLPDDDDRIVLGVDAAQHPGFQFQQRARDEPIYLVGRSAATGGLPALLLLTGDPDDAQVTVVHVGIAGGFHWLGNTLVYRVDDQLFAVVNGATEHVQLTAAPTEVAGDHLMMSDWYHDRLFFWGREPGGDGPVDALYVTDGTPEGTLRLATFCVGARSGCD